MRHIDAVSSFKKDLIVTNAFKNVFIFIMFTKWIYYVKH